MGLFGSKVAHRARSGTLVTNHNFERNMLGGIGLYLQFRFPNHSKYNISRDYFLIEESWQTGAPIGPVSNPHFAAVNVARFEFRPVPEIESFAFLVKKSDADPSLAVLHASLYKRWVNYSFLILHVPKGRTDTKEFKHLRHSCILEGIGLIIFHEADVIESFHLLGDALRFNPPSQATDEFIKVQFSSECKAILKGWIR